MVGQYHFFEKFVQRTLGGDLDHACVNLQTVSGLVPQMCVLVLLQNARLLARLSVAIFNAFLIACCMPPHMYLEKG